jgi:hypothetical protein
VMFVIRNLTTMFSYLWSKIQTFLGPIVTFILRGKQCILLAYSKISDYLTLRYFALTISGKIKVSGKTVWPGIRPPIIKVLFKFLARIPYLGPIFQLVYYTYMYTPLGTWVDYKIDRELMVPLFDNFRSDILGIVIPLFDSTLSWSCRFMQGYDQIVLEHIRGMIDSQAQSANTEITNSIAST